MNISEIGLNYTYLLLPFGGIQAPERFDKEGILSYTFATCSVGVSGQILKGIKAMAETGNMPFQIKDCTLITRMAGVRNAMNLRELQERISQCSVECLFHHFCETVIRPTFDDPEYRNDFAVWAARQLRDRVLAERLAIINPYGMDSLEDLRMQVLDILEERLAEIYYIPWAPPGRDFHFMQAATVVFDTGIFLVSPEDLRTALPQMSLGSIYYHFVEARRRTDNGLDDFSVWISGFDRPYGKLLGALAGLDFYYLSLPELKQSLIEVAGGVASEKVYG